MILFPSGRGAALVCVHFPSWEEVRNLDFRTRNAAHDDAAVQMFDG